MATITNRMYDNTLIKRKKDDLEQDELNALQKKQDNLNHRVLTLEQKAVDVTKTHVDDVTRVHRKKYTQDDTLNHLANLALVTAVIIAASQLK